MRPVTDRLSPTITVLVLVSAVLAAFYALVRPIRGFVENHLALRPWALSAPEPWQVVTSLFVHVEPISLIFNIIGLWFVGAAMERELGRRRFLLLFFVPVVTANLFTAVAMLFGYGAPIVAGSSLAVLGLFVAFGRLYGRTPARVFGSLVLEARTLTLILVGFALLADLTRGDLVAVGADLVTIGIAFGLAGGRGPSLGDIFRGRPGGKPRRRFQVVEGGQKSPDKGAAGKDGRRAGYLN